MAAVSGFAASTAQLRRKAASAASALPPLQSGRSEKWTRDKCRLKPDGGLGGGALQATKASSATARSCLFRNIAGGRHQHPVGVRGIQVALEGPDVNDGAGGEPGGEADG